jgi:hypothetical protein
LDLITSIRTFAPEAQQASQEASTFAGLAALFTFGGVLTFKGYWRGTAAAWRGNSASLSACSSARACKFVFDLELSSSSWRRRTECSAITTLSADSAN